MHHPCLYIRESRCCWRMKMMAKRWSHQFHLYILRLKQEIWSNDGMDHSWTHCLIKTKRDAGWFVAQTNCNIRLMCKCIVEITMAKSVSHLGYIFIDQSLGINGLVITTTRQNRIHDSFVITHVQWPRINMIGRPGLLNCWCAQREQVGCISADDSFLNMSVLRIWRMSSGEQK